MALWIGSDCSSRCWVISLSSARPAARPYKLAALRRSARVLRQALPMPVELSQPALAACALLFVQNTFSTLVISYSRLRPGPAYVGSVVVALGELVKIVLNLLCNLVVFGCAATREELRRVYCTEARQP